MTDTYKTIRAANVGDLWRQIADHMRQGWRPIGQVDAFDNDLGGTDWVQPMKNMQAEEKTA